MAVAYAWRTGEIGIGNELPKGAQPIAKAEDQAMLKNVITDFASRAPDGETLLVPGIPEAESDGEAMEALMNFSVDVIRTLHQRAA